MSMTSKICPKNTKMLNRFRKREICSQKIDLICMSAAP